MNIDGTNAVLGRLATAVAKKLMEGEAVSIVHADKIIITGNPSATIKKYHKRREIGSPHHGPFFPKTPEGIVRRAIRGMMPYKTKKGRAAFKKLRIYSGKPESIANLEKVAVNEINSNYITIGKISRQISGK
jgi:large subunit ribosomal protein L13